MAKSSTGRASGKAKSPPPPAVARKKAKAAAPVAKTARTKAVASVKKAAPPKMAAAPRKAAVAKGSPLKKAASAKKAAGKGKAPPPRKAAQTKAAPTKKAIRKTAPPVKAKKVAVKKPVARRPASRIASPTPAARRARTVASPRKSPAASRRQPAAAAVPPPRVPPPQTFTVSHLRQEDFKPDGLRTYAQYRDLGIAVATGGLCQAHVIRFTPPCTDEVRKRHTHQTDLQLVYVLQGWMKNEFEGHGEQMMSAGSCWLQPTGIKHTVLDYSPDCEVLEIIVPADFTTEETA